MGVLSLQMAQQEVCSLDRKQTYLRFRPLDRGYNPSQSISQIVTPDFLGGSHVFRRILVKRNYGSNLMIWAIWSRGRGVLGEILIKFSS